MRVLITGACGFVGSTLVRTWKSAGTPLEFYGIDNLTRPGSEVNREAIRRLGVRFVHGDVRLASDIDALPPVDWVVDAAAETRVLAATEGRGTSRQLAEHNLIGTINLLEYCARHRAGLILLSTSRVYSISRLSHIPLSVERHAFRPDDQAGQSETWSARGVTEAFSTEPPLSLYGATKLAAETLALEYGHTFGFPVWVNRCGVLAGAGQFARPDQGIFSFWIHSWRARRPLSYIGFGGLGHQVRDCLHPADLVPLMELQMSRSSQWTDAPVQNVSGGADSACSLRQCSDWCADRFGAHTVGHVDVPRPHDIPWIVLDPTRATRRWGWTPQATRDQIFEEIACAPVDSAEWLDRSASA